MSSHSFDPLPLAADHMHARSCGEGHDMPGRDCLLARGLAADWLDDLREAGLAPVPMLAMQFLERRFAEQRDSNQGDAEAGPSDPSWDRHRAMCWIELSFADCRTDRLGPMPHWQAEIWMGSLPFDRPADCVGAVIVAEAGWVRGLLDELADV